MWKLVGLAAAIGVWDGAFPKGSSAEFVEFVGIFILIAGSLAIGIYFSHWCHWDDLEHGRKANKTLAGVTIIVPPLGIALHMLRGRGARGVVVGILMIAFWGVLCVVAAMSSWLAEICCRIFR